MDDAMLVPRRFLSEFMKALNFHNGHGEPTFSRVSAVMLHEEARDLLRGSPSAAAALSEPFKAEDDYAPSYVTGPNGFRFQCYNAVEMARQLNAMFSPSATASANKVVCPFCNPLLNANDPNVTGAAPHVPTETADRNLPNG